MCSETKSLAVRETREEESGDNICFGSGESICKILYR